MYYENFEYHITMKHGVVREKWPLPDFKNPSSMTRMEVEILLRALENGAATFRSLSNEEWKAWLDDYLHGADTNPADDPAMIAMDEPSVAAESQPPSPLPLADATLDANTKIGRAHV